MSVKTQPIQTPAEIARKQGFWWNEAGTMPELTSEPSQTQRGTPYLQSPGLVLLAKPQTELVGMTEFLRGFGPDLGFLDTINEYLESDLEPAAQVCKASGQLCYLSFGPNRTPNKEAARYFENILSSGHFSVLEHANFTFLFYGISRSLTHELVRHRHMSFSQVSQRYVDGSKLRFVERPEFAANPALHEAFVNRIDMTAIEYEAIATSLLMAQEGGEATLSAKSKTDRRKRVNQGARAVLPNDTEAPIIVTANARAWRHFLEMRATPHAEVEIRRLAFLTWLALAITAPLLFGDFTPHKQADDAWTLITPYRGA